jgi:glyoxylase-like metal-dependent hydrolase (beta-lactamase superfamily II)
MPTAAEFQLVTPHLAFWQAYEPAVKCDLSCCATVTPAGLVFIDPIPLARPALAELAHLAPPVAIVCTNGNHARAAEEYRARFSIPICAHAAAVAELGLAVDRELRDGDVIGESLTVLELPGAGPGEIALHSAEGAMHVGDALIHIEPMGFALLPDKYCADAREMRHSLGKLLRFDFELLSFAHGLPLAAKARRRLESLLA